MIEDSLSIKCPNIGYHLVGAKKVQQYLANEGVVAKFVPEEVAKRLRASWTGLYSLSEPEKVRNGRPTPR